MHHDLLRHPVVCKALLREAPRRRLSTGLRHHPGPLLHRRQRSDVREHLWRQHVQILALFPHHARRRHARHKAQLAPLQSGEGMGQPRDAHSERRLLLRFAISWEPSRDGMASALLRLRPHRLCRISLSAVQLPHVKKSLRKPDNGACDPLRRRPMPRDLPRSIPPLHRQDELHIPAQHSRDVSDHHSGGLRSAVSVAPVEADLLRGQLQLERNHLALLMAKQDHS